jgi:hypothetical protein
VRRAKAIAENFYQGMVCRKAWLARGADGAATARQHSSVVSGRGARCFRQHAVRIHHHCRGFTDRSRSPSVAFDLVGDVVAAIDAFFVRSKLRRRRALFSA